MIVDCTKCQKYYGCFRNPNNCDIYLGTHDEAKEIVKVCPVADCRHQITWIAGVGRCCPNTQCPRYRKEV